MAKKKKAGLIIAMVGVLAIGGICTGLAIWANKKEKDAESSAVDYSLEKDRQMIVGTYRSFEDLPVVLTLEIKGYTPERKDEKKSFASDADMTTQAGQNSNAVWTDLSSWVSTFLGEKESLTGFFGSGEPSWSSHPATEETSQAARCSSRIPESGSSAFRRRTATRRRSREPMSSFSKRSNQQ